MIIKKCWGGHLGDVWAFISYCLITDNLYVSAVAADGINISSKIIEILDLLDHPNASKVTICDDEPLDKMVNDSTPVSVVNQWFAWSARYVPTKCRWDYARPIVTTQLVGARLFADVKSITGFQQDEFDSVISEMGLTSVPVGGQFSLAECVMNMAESKCFIGIDSGMSHVAHSVGVPVVLIESKMDISGYHANKPCKIVTKACEFRDFLASL